MVASSICVHWAPRSPYLAQIWVWNGTVLIPSFYINFLNYFPNKSSVSGLVVEINLPIWLPQRGSPITFSSTCLNEHWKQLSTWASPSPNWNFSATESRSLLQPKKRRLTLKWKYFFQWRVREIFRLIELFLECVISYLVHPSWGRSWRGSPCRRKIRSEPLHTRVVAG